MAYGKTNQSAKDVAAIDTDTPAADEFISAASLAKRWHCSRSTAYRLARQNFKVYCLGSGGKNSLIRFSFRDVLAFEAARRV